eukprot:TRINITY_DN27134_c0_g1_i1.p1 TRINITY_DN27134_c0_g1~~TRINITY_DN27134_c0_g1_i1.p1  ORF type:complete len:654 (+),score=241.05 TRINITY_DN27134_c0_g1_i1:28-1989(+)
MHSGGPQHPALTMAARWLAVALLSASAAGKGALPMGRWGQVHPAGAPAKPSVVNCTWRYYEDQRLDHFGELETTWAQRYCLYDKFWKGGGEVGFGNTNGERAPIFFYTGNESPVEEYVNNTGLMWELGEKMGALIVFAEHRYEGKSVPKMHGVPYCLSYCTSAQALADYAQLVGHLKAEYATDAPVVAFGGSYGGMLAGWFRIKYPEVVAGAIAASAPVAGFPSNLGTAGLDSSAACISNGVKAKGGATDQCFDNLRAAWVLMTEVGKTETGRALIAEAAQRCDPASPVEDIVGWAQGPLFYMAEGNYPFPSTYITFSVGPGLNPLPAWPMRKACEGLNQDFGIQTAGNPDAVDFSLTMKDINVKVSWDEADGNGASLTEAQIKASGVLDLVKAVTAGAAVWQNVTKDKTCYGPKPGEAAHPAEAAPKRRETASPSSSTEKCESCPVCPECTARCPLCDREADKTVCTYVDQPEVSKTFAWGPVCCNEDIYLANTEVQGVGRDVYWPPTAKRNFTIEDVVGKKGAKTAGCAAGYDADGLFGTPTSGDNWGAYITEYYHADEYASFRNIAWSNGALDPWSGGGVFAKGMSWDGPMVQDLTPDGSSKALVIDLGGHHLDLFFATPEDPPSAVRVREEEAALIRRWAQEHYDTRGR